MDDPNINAAFLHEEECLSPPRGLGCAPHDGKAVHVHRDSMWFFWDETWSNELGPYNTQAEAEEACIQYAKSL
jgi:hypothetical protein